MRVRSFVFAMLVAAGCSSSKPSSEGSSGVQPDVAKGKEIFGQRCVPCHGSSGHGDGPASATLDPKPRKFADHSWQTQVSDDYIERIIRLGGSAVGKSAAMPSNPDLSDPQVVAGLRAVVREFDGK